MAEFATPEWIEALDEAVRSSDDLRAVTADLQLTIRQTITDTDEGEPVSWHFVIDRGSVRVHAGPGDHADVTFTEEDGTARAIASGAISPQTAFMTGRLQVGGDTAKMMEHAAAFDGLADIFEALRADTVY